MTLLRDDHGSVVPDPVESEDHLTEGSAVEDNPLTNLELRALAADLAALKADVRSVGITANQIAVVDAKLLNNSSEISRLSSRMEDYMARMEEMRETDHQRNQLRDEQNGKEHAEFKRVINMAIGGGAVIWLLSSGTLMYAVSTISNLVANNQQLAMDVQMLKQYRVQHDKEDQIQSESDLRKALQDIGVIPPLMVIPRKPEDK